jgi:hypothetical protein
MHAIWFKDRKSKSCIDHYEEASCLERGVQINEDEDLQSLQTMLSRAWSKAMNAQTHTTSLNRSSNNSFIFGCENQLCVKIGKSVWDADVKTDLSICNMVAYRARKAKYEEVQVSIIVRDRNL